MLYLVYYLPILIPVWFLMLQLLGTYSFLAKEQKAKKSQSDLYISNNKALQYYTELLIQKIFFSETWLY